MAEETHNEIKNKQTLVKKDVDRARYQQLKDATGAMVQEIEEYKRDI